MTITKSYKSHHFAANKICDIPVYLGAIPLYNGHNYYMWDARENYWSGHEWDASDAWQPTKNTVGNDDYPKSKEADGARWYNDVEGPLEASVNPLFKQLPNANELAWYVLKGDCYWDNSSLWKAFDKVHSGGIWLKKLSVIAEENGKKPAELKQNDPNGKNLLTFSNPQSYKFPPKFGKPSDSEIGKYFFLPAMGHYTQGDTYHFGFGGSYWSSTADPSYNRGAYCLNFFYGAVELYYEPRTRGCIAQPFESPSPIVLF
ncbi:MAG: hypothetical protein SOW45_10975 [Prevotella sp.]|nr:hypothetical protein [Prevotella sp.]